MSDDSSSSAMTMLVAIIAIVVIAGVGYFVVRSMNGNASDATINVDLPGGDGDAQ